MELGLADSAADECEDAFRTPQVGTSGMINPPSAGEGGH